MFYIFSFFKNATTSSKTQFFKKVAIEVAVAEALAGEFVFASSCTCYLNSENHQKVLNSANF